MAQSVERRIGSAEVTGPIPVTSFLKVQYLLDFLFFVLHIIRIMQCSINIIQRVSLK